MLLYIFRNGIIVIVLLGDFQTETWLMLRLRKWVFTKSVKVFVRFDAWIIIAKASWTLWQDSFVITNYQVIGYIDKINAIQKCIEVPIVWIVLLVSHGPASHL